jgi:hypothetical protein
VNIEPNEEIQVFFYLNNAWAVAALDVAWDWDDSWVIDPNETGITYTGCTTNTVTIRTPQNPGGPQAGRLVSAFDCLTGGFLRIGRMDFHAGPSGCLEFVQVPDGYGTHLVDCQNQRDESNPESPAPNDSMRFGRICIHTGGNNSCWAIPNPVEPATWGAIKETYNR